MTLKSMLGGVWAGPDLRDQAGPQRARGLYSAPYPPAGCRGPGGKLGHSSGVCHDRWCPPGCPGPAVGGAGEAGVERGGNGKVCTGAVAVLGSAGCGDGLPCSGRLHSHAGRMLCKARGAERGRAPPSAQARPLQHPPALGHQQTHRRSLCFWGGKGAAALVGDAPAFTSVHTLVTTGDVFPIMTPHSVTSTQTAAPWANDTRPVRSQLIRQRDEVLLEVGMGGTVRVCDAWIVCTRPSCLLVCLCGTQV